jgi:Flp pilus assembly protein TadB
LIEQQVALQVAQEKQTIDVRVEQDSDIKAIEKLEANRAWCEAEEKRLRLLRERDETYRALLQKWLNLTFGNLHRTSNSTTFFYLVWTPLVIFWSVIITWSLPNAIACPKPDGICHNTRMLALSFREQVTVIPKFLSKLLGY